jgi:hypothetical protein
MPAETTVVESSKAPSQSILGTLQCIYNPAEIQRGLYRELSAVEVLRETGTSLIKYCFRSRGSIVFSVQIKDMV